MDKSSYRVFRRIRDCPSTLERLASMIEEQYANSGAVAAPSFPEQQAVSCLRSGQIPGVLHLQLCDRCAQRSVKYGAQYFDDSDDERWYAYWPDLASKCQTLLDLAGRLGQASVLMVFPVLGGNFIAVCGMPAALVVRDIADESRTMAATIADFVEAWAKNAPPADTFLCGFWTVAEVEALGLVVTYSQETGGHAFNSAADDMAKGFVTERALMVAAIQHYLRGGVCEIKFSIPIGVAAICSISAAGVEGLFAPDKCQGRGFSSIACDWDKV